MSYDEEQDRAQSAIDTIEYLWPPDSDYSDTAEIGQQDLVDALAVEWRALPLPVLENMARAQQARDHRGADNALDRSAH